MTPQIICLGELLIDFNSPTAEKNIIEAGVAKLAPGGAPANVAVGLARLGTAAGFIGRVGDDFFGRFLKSVLDDNAVDTTHLSFDSTANTGLAFVHREPNGDNTYLFYRSPSADIMLRPEHIKADYIEQAQVLQFGSLLMAQEPSRWATLQALDYAQSAGVLLSFDPNLRTSVWPSAEAALMTIGQQLGRVQILKISRSELKFLSGETDPAKGTQKLWRDNLKIIVVTLDSDGCFYRTAHHSEYLSAQRVEQVVDTVGAGDGFVAGLLDGLRRANFAWDDTAAIRKACQQASIVGALTVTKFGGIPSLPTRAEVDNFAYQS